MSRKNSKRARAEARSPERVAYTLYQEHIDYIQEVAATRHYGNASAALREIIDRDAKRGGD